MKETTFHLLAIVFGIAASLLAVLAVAEYEAYIPVADVDNLTSTELGTLSALSVVAALGFGYVAKS